MNNSNLSPTSNIQPQHQHYWILITLLAVILLAAVIRIRLVDVPLERDEGEYAYAGQLILQGIPPYQLFYYMKLPGIYAAYACVMAIFGQTHTGIHLGLLVINAVTIILVFLLAKRGCDPIAGVVGAACFAVLSIDQSIQGVFANAEHFVILPAVGGLLLLLRGTDDDRPWMLFFSGLLLGTAFLIKQPGAAFVAFGGLYTLIHQLYKRPVDWSRLASLCVVFILGAVIPYGLACLILAWAGVFERFWFWTADYAMAYSSQIPIDSAWTLFKDRAACIGGSTFLIWGLAGLGVTTVMWDNRMRHRSIFIAMFILFSFLAICPGFYFRRHYFVLTLPATAVLAGIAISVIANRLSNNRFRFVKYGLPILLAAACLGVSVYQQRQYLFELTPIQVCRSTYWPNPFPESLEISQFLRTNSKKDERIAVIGSEPQIYFYSGRRSATGYIYMYALMEDHDFAWQMQKEMIREIESSQPKFLIFVAIPTSWLERPYSHKLVFEWFEHYRRKHYTLVGLADLFGDRTIYHWAPNVKWPPRSNFWVAVFERKEVG